MRPLMIAAVLVLVPVLALAQIPCNCPQPPAVQIDWLGATTGCKPNGPFCATNEVIQFTVKSLGRPFQVCDVFDWDFGDGSHSSQQNPAHLYTIGLSQARVIFLLTNCSGGFQGDAQEINIVLATVLPSISQFKVTPSSALPGKSVVFTWVTGNGSKSVRLENVHASSTPAILKVTLGASGSFTYTPASTIDVTLTALGDAAQRISQPIRVELIKRQRAARH